LLRKLRLGEPCSAIIVQQAKAAESKRVASGQARNRMGQHRRATETNRMAIMIARMATIATLAASLLMAAVAGAQADKRVALVIGNSAYRNVPALPNPANDAAAMALLFKNAGFDSVDMRRDVGVSELRRAVREFADKSQDADIAVVFYAGHGIEVGGGNYLVPIDARLASDFDIEDETVSLDRISQAIEPARRLRLVILDACRDNPFAKTMKRSVSTRSIGRGLAKVEPAASDTLIAFAAKAGSVATDGDGADSPFTTALVKYLTAPGLDLRIALGKVRDDVLAATHRKQEPFVYGSLGGTTVALVSTPGANAATDAAPIAPGPAAATDPDAQARRDFDLANLVGTAQGWDAFLARHPSGFFAELARQQRAKLATPGAVAALPPADADKNAASRSLGRFGGTTVEIGVDEEIHEIRPGNTVWAVHRTIAVYLREGDELPTRVISQPRNSNAKRDVTLTGTIGGRGTGPSWNIEGDQLSGTVKFFTFAIKPVVRINGSACTATISYLPLGGGTEFKLARTGNGQPFFASSITARSISCKVSQGDQVTQR
jgi:uncharacterized caspase-like protein